MRLVLGLQYYRVCDKLILIPTNYFDDMFNLTSASSVEGAYYIATKHLTSLSEQQLVSCDKIDNGLVDIQEMSTYFYVLSVGCMNGSK